MPSTLSGTRTGREMTEILISVVFALAVLLGGAAIFLYRREPKNTIEQNMDDDHRGLRSMERISPYNSEMYERMKRDSKH